MHFLIDAQLPIALARWLQIHGFIATHVTEVDLGGASDTEIWSYASSRSMIIVSKDEDFARNECWPNPGRLSFGSAKEILRKQELLTWFEAALPPLVDALSRGDILVELT